MAQTMLDSLGWAYIGLSVVWTVALIAGMLFLYYHRRLPCLQIRRLPLVFAGVSSLHIYGLAPFIGYKLGPLFPCTVEFWIMSIYLPFGIAMFHAANSQFLHIASRQKQYARMSSLSDRGPVKEEQAQRLANSRIRRILRGVERADKIDRMMVWIGIGMVIQIALTLFVFFGSRKFHESYGLFDYTVEGTATEVRMKCAKGWEWWLSIVWQFFWAWIYAPYMLWKSRGIRDVHGWRLQTICCCLAGLPASPMWLVGLYVPQMMSVNMYFFPPAWFGVCIFFMEVFTIAFPIAQVLKTQTLRQETLDAIASWERRQELQEMQANSGSTVASTEAHSDKSGAYAGTTYQSNASKSYRKSSLDSQKSDMFTMVALENALRTNAEPLLQFAALKDFSGENVSFLTHLAEWKRAWFIVADSVQTHRHQQFLAAVRIYGSFVSLDFSEFPINLSSREMKHLHSIFEAAAAMLLRRGSVSSTGSVTPFDVVPADSPSTVDLKSGIDLDALGRKNLRAITGTTDLGQDNALSDFRIPEEFTPQIFSNAEQEIKYLILTNTWPRFVHAAFENSEGEKDELHIFGDNWWSRLRLCSV